MRQGFLVALMGAVLLGSLPARAQQSVDVELVLLADASGSIDNAEIRFQREGYAQALLDPEILQAIGVGFDGQIALTYVEWGTTGSQDVVVPWTIVADENDARAFGKALRAAPRRAFGRNAMGEAIAFARSLIESNEIEGYRKVIDLSADSANSWSGLPLETARQQAAAAGIVINGLAIACRHEGCGGRPVSYDLEAAFERLIVTGPASFVVTADGRTSFADAVRRKLLLEIAGITPQPRKADDVAQLTGDRRTMSLPVE